MEENGGIYWCCNSSTSDLPKERLKKRLKKVKWWNLFRVLTCIGIILIGAMMLSGKWKKVFPNASAQSYLGILAPETGEEIQIRLANESGSKFIQLNGNKLQVSGRVDAERRYFDGSVSLAATDIYLKNYSTMESVKLEKDKRAFALGEYCIFCYPEDAGQMSILVLYCPE